MALNRSATAQAVARHPPLASFSAPVRARSPINRRAFAAFFPTEALRTQIKQPLVVTETTEKFDVVATDAGGGVSGQAGPCGWASRARCAS